MAGGTFINQNKVRPGAYINFKSVPKPTSNVGTRGIVTMPLALDWGISNKIIMVYSTDLVDGKCLDKIGYYGHEPQVQAIREALKNSYLLLLYRLDTGGTKAATTLEGLTITAKYPGVVGNRISIVIKELENSKFNVITLLDNKVVHEQIATTIETIQPNAWVDFLGTGEIVATAGKQLSEGTNGTVATENYTSYLNTIKPKLWNTMGVYTTESAAKESISKFIQDLRENKGKKVQAVLNEYTTKDYEGIISVDDGYKTESETVNVDGFVAYVAGLTAGTPINKSNTYHVIPGAIEIINPKDDTEIENALISGKLVLSYRQDEKVIIEQDINTLSSFTIEKGKEFSKNRIIRTLDDVNNTTKLIYEKTYIGKVDNNDNGRNLFKAELVSYMTELQNMGAIRDFKTDDITIRQGNDIDSVVVELAIWPVDAMEKLYLTVSVH